MYEIIQQEFYLRDTVTVARELLGKRLVVKGDDGEIAVELTETEAYTGVNDRACHTFGGRRTARTEIMYRTGGCAYVYLIYGMYNMLNIVTEPEGNPCAVLVRAARVVEGHDLVAGARAGKPWKDLTARQQKLLLSGPGKLCSGLGIAAKVHNGLEVDKGPLTLREGEGTVQVGDIHVGKRIGIDYAGEDAHLPYRFWID